MSATVPYHSLPIGLSYSEFLQWLDEDIRAEWVDGESFIMRPASRRHQRLSDFLTAILKLYVEPKRLGEVISAPFQMKPAEELPGREPDILFVAGERLHIIQDTFVAGPADLVVEILSPESRKRDTVDKFSEYERAVVRVYWMIDPENRDAKFFELTGDQYSLIPTEQRIFRSQRIEGFGLISTGCGLSRHLRFLKFRKGGARRTLEMVSKSESLSRMRTTFFRRSAAPKFRMGRHRLELFSLCLAAIMSARAEPISLHPENPHYFQYQGQPTVLITSAEHYGAVLNLDFDYATYLDALAADGLNLTRTFTGVYVEPDGAFNIERNTLAPDPERLICPWARSSEAGYANGGAKFDLERWDDAYFARLRDFVARAGERGIIVELALFCPMYKEAQWSLSPMNAANNVNGIGNVARDEVYTLDKSSELLAIQVALTRKIVAELRGADNVCYEICNEPYFGGVTLEWQRHIADVIYEAEKDFPHRHLITQNIANGSQKIEDPHPAVSVFNFHYAHPPTAVALNYGLNKVIGDNETGFKGTSGDHYRMEAWEFIIAGGGLYNNLDYSFTVGHEDGTFDYPPTQPGGGGPEFRRQMRLLKDFIHGFDFLKMKPARDQVVEIVPSEARYQMLAELGRQYAAYFKGATSVAMDLPEGRYRIQWTDGVDGRATEISTLSHPGGTARLDIPEDMSEVALKVTLGAD